MQTTFILLEIKHSKPIEEITDLVAGRVYTMTHVEDVTARLIPEDEVAHKGVKDE